MISCNSARSYGLKFWCTFPYPSAAPCSIAWLHGSGSQPAPAGTVVVDLTGAGTLNKNGGFNHDKLQIYRFYIDFRVGLWYLWTIIQLEVYETSTLSLGKLWFMEERERDIYIYIQLVNGSQKPTKITVESHLACPNPVPKNASTVGWWLDVNSD